jgi:hypothetical protein
MAAVDVSLGTADDRRVKLAIRVDVREHLFRVVFHVAWERLDRPPYNLDVLLRHRPRSIPQAKRARLSGEWRGSRSGRRVHRHAFEPLAEIS